MPKRKLRNSNCINHKWYDISIEHIKCEVCWDCGRIREKEINKKI